jgi:hypothetical protein
MLLKVCDRFSPQKLKNLAGFIVLVKEHEELFFGGDGRSAQRNLALGGLLFRSRFLRDFLHRFRGFPFRHDFIPLGFKP